MSYFGIREIFSVGNYIPPEQGLKLDVMTKQSTSSPVGNYIPPEQGLKQQRERIQRWERIPVGNYIPPEQGLKHFFNAYYTEKKL